MKKRDKSQGIVFVLPKSKEFFGRVSRDFQKEGLATQPMIKKPEPSVDMKEQVESLGEIKENLSKLTRLHQRLKKLLKEIDTLVEEDA